MSLLVFCDMQFGACLTSGGTTSDLSLNAYYPRSFSATQTVLIHENSRIKTTICINFKLQNRLEFAVVFRILKQPRRGGRPECRKFAYLTTNNRTFARLASALFPSRSRSFHGASWPALQLCGRLEQFPTILFFISIS